MTLMDKIVKAMADCRWGLPRRWSHGDDRLAVDICVPELRIALSGLPGVPYSRT